jgi:hypothetical protein
VGLHNGSDGVFFFRLHAVGNGSDTHGKKQKSGEYTLEPSICMTVQYLTILQDTLREVMQIEGSSVYSPLFCFFPWVSIMVLTAFFSSDCIMKTAHVLLTGFNPKNGYVTASVLKDGTAVPIASG